MPDGTKQPNIVFTLADNSGWADYSCYGAATPTPRIDSIAKDGMQFTNYNVESQCTPTRTAIMTGRQSIRSGTYLRISSSASSVRPSPTSARRLTGWLNIGAEWYGGIGIVLALILWIGLMTTLLIVSSAFAAAYTIRPTQRQRVHDADAPTAMSQPARSSRLVSLVRSAGRKERT